MTVLTQGGPVLECRDPSRPDEVIGEVAPTDPAAVADLAAGLRARPLPTADERADRLRALAGGLRDAAPALAAALTAEVGKMPDEAALEVGFAATIAEAYAAILDGAASKGDVGVEGPDGGIRRRPVGLGGAITPFNFPVSITTIKLAAAYGAGAAALWKPSPHAAHLSAAYHELLDEHLGGAVALVQGDGAEHLHAVVRAVDAVSFTGGAPGADVVWAACAGRPLPLQLELGSCNATIVAPSFATADAVDLLHQSVFGYAGQKCSSTRRVLVARDRLAAVAEALSSRVEADRVGDPRNPSTTCPPVIAPRAAAGLATTMTAWAAAGASLRSAAPNDASPCFFAPTVAVAEGDDPAFRVDAFGPVCVVIPYDDPDEAVALAGATDFGLYVGLLTQDDDDVARVLAADVAGIVKINRTTPGLDVGLPSQGWAASGVGPSELGPDPFAIFQRTQTVYPYVMGTPR
jgi:acyl-CoA reductase-like NAD-dependent aldehyde dehydrogenase